MTWILDYLPQILMTVGVLALTIEVIVLGFATFILLFIGMALFLSGLMMQLGLLDTNINNAVWLSVVLTSMFAILLWKPLKNIQNKQPAETHDSDFAQVTFTLTGDIDSTSTDVFHSYSGINWQVRSSVPLQKGQHVKVIKSEVGILWVEATE